MKKLTILLAMLTLSSAAYSQNIISTNITAGAGLHLISTNRIKLYSLEVSTTNATSFAFYDNDDVNNVPTAATAGFYGTNVVTGAYLVRSSYATNVASSYVGYNGYTNWYTNAGIYTVSTTNAAATNALPVSLAVNTAGAETRVTYADVIFTRGVLVHTTGNGSVTVYYRNEQ